MAEYVVIDFETTGLDHNRDEIVQLSAIKFDDHGLVIDVMKSFCRPLSGSIPVEASNIHHITYEMVQDCPSYVEIRDALAQFIGDRTVVGHNVIDFDLKFAKIRPKNVIDTLVWCRQIWPNKNNLASACKRLKIEFNKEDAHDAVYDTKKTMELFLTLKAMREQQAPPQQMVLDITKPKLEHTQPYSFSRISLFHQCPWKWFQVYILKKKESSQPLVVGSCIHLVAQMSALWCYSRSFGNRFSAYMHGLQDKTLPIGISTAMDAAVAKGDAFYLPKDKKYTSSDIGMFLYMNRGYIKQLNGITDIVDLINKVALAVPDPNSYEVVERPPREVYDVIVQRAIAKSKISDADALSDLRFLTEYFYNQKEFLVIDGQLSLIEQRICYDKDWNVLRDFFDAKAYFRGVLDIIEYNSSDYVTITDYKSGRKMLTEEQLRNDQQLQVYIMLLHKLMKTVKTIRVRHHYIRYGKIVEAIVEDLDAVSAKALAWIDESIIAIEKMLLEGESAFKPERNQFCGSCQFCDNGECPLFNIKHVNDIKDPAKFEIKSLDDFRTAYKKMEVNKAENSALTKKCKAYLEHCQSAIVIDEKAMVDMWVKEDKEFDVEETVKLLLTKGMKLGDFIKHLSLTKSAWEKIDKLAQKMNVAIEDEELARVTKPTRRTEFKALTQEELEDDGYINVRVDQPKAEA